MYEKTIASEHKLWSIVIPTTKIAVIDLLSPSDRAEYDALILVGTPYKAYNNRNVQRVPIDGYVICDSSDFYVSTSIDSSAAEELAPSTIPYTIPVAYWLDNTFIRAGSDVSAKLRVFFS